MHFIKMKRNTVVWNLLLQIVTISLFSSNILAFPQELPESQTEQESAITTESEVIVQNDESEEDGSDIDISEIEDEVLQDQMAKYTNVPYITGTNTDCKCGMPINRIIGGESAEISQYPWTALLNSVESENYRIAYCGASLINNQYILTGAHCTDGLDPKKIEVVLRAQNISMDTEEDENMLLITRSMVMGGSNKNLMSVLRIGVEKVILHPGYSRRTLDNDIALIKLKVRVPLGPGFQLAPICVPQATASFSQGIQATVAGYGAISESESPALGLQMAEVRVLSNELCNTRAFHNGKITENMLCADGHGKGPCAGDTGGPLMVRSSRETTRQILAGIASWSSTCLDPTRPAVYTRVPMYESWILENTQDASWCSE